ncbi:MAG TPA: GAF domain-containing sensor histidine kinase [Bryobacteraceae bacterium]
MQPAASSLSPELADAADVLSDRLREQLETLAARAQPQIRRVERQFAARLRQSGLEPRERNAISAITPGAAARLLVGGRSPLEFIEQVEYNGRRLAKLKLPPSAVRKALREYDGLLSEALTEPERGGFQWVRDQLHFCVILTLNNAYYQVREAETRAFYDQFRIELESRNLEELLGRFLESLVQVSSADAGHLYLLNEDRTAWALKAVMPAARLAAAPQSVPNRAGIQKKLAQPQYLAIDRTGGNGLLLDPCWREIFSSCWSIPLSTGGRAAGVMQFGFRKEYEWLPRERELLAAAAERCLMAAEKQRLMEDLASREEQVRRLAEHMLHVEEIERRRISRELHDEAGQSLLCIRLHMEMLERNLPGARAAAQPWFAQSWLSRLREARDLTERTILEMRRLIAALSPAVLEQLGLGAALRQLLTRFQRLHPCRVKLQTSKLEALPKKIQIIVYRLVQECFNNIGKHSGATRASIALHFAEETLRLAVEDNGVGFDVEEALSRRDSFGLAGMRERVALLGGKFQVESRKEVPKRGTRISVELPISH